MASKIGSITQQSQGFCAFVSKFSDEIRVIAVIAAEVLVMAALYVYAPAAALVVTGVLVGAGVILGIYADSLTEAFVGFMFH